MLKIVTAEERIAEIKGPKILIAGVPKIGKTSLLRTLSPQTMKRTLLIDIEAGDLAVQDVPISAIRPDEGQHWTWKDCVDIACLLGGPNAGHDDTLPYNPTHYAKVVETLGFAVNPENYDLYYIDSITQASQLCLKWAAQQPEAFTKEGKPDPRGMYGLAGRHLVMWLTQFQNARKKGVIYVCILEENSDDFGRKTWGLQIAGGMAGRALPGIVDQIMTLMFVEFEGGARARALVTQQENAEKVPGGDRSGRLEAYEPPDLSVVLAKLTTRNVNADAVAAQ